MYIYELGTTGTVSFSDFLVTTELVSQVSQATQLRARVRAVLKENRAGASSSSAKDKESSKAADIGGDIAREGAGSTSDWLSIVKAVEEYVPHLLAVFNCVQTDDLILRYEPVFSWRTSISSTRFRGPQRVQVAGLHYELASTLLTYALTLSNFAAATVQALGSFERDRNISSDERKRKDDRLRWAADTLCRASGILLYLSQELLPKWRDHVGRIEGLPPDLTMEATLALSKVCLAEAQALAIRKLVSPSVGKAVDTVTPGPPLEKGHPSASLLAKLHLNVVEELESATGLLKTVGDKSKSASGSAGGAGNGTSRRGGDAGLSANHEHGLARRMSATNDDHAGGARQSPLQDGVDGAVAGKGKKLFGKFRTLSKQGDALRTSGPHDGPLLSNGAGGGATNFYAAPSSSASIGGGMDRELEINTSLLKYLSFCTTLHRALAYKWLAIDAGETSSRIGTAIALLSLSSSLLSSTALSDLGGSLSTLSISSASLLPSKPRAKGRAAHKDAVQQELATVQHWLSSYRKLNDTVSFQPVPAPAEVQSQVPAGRAALQVKKLQLPSPSFGPGSQGYTGRGDGWRLAKDQLHLLDHDHPAHTNLVALHGEHSADTGTPAGPAGPPGAAGYAGQGAYY